MGEKKDGPRLLARPPESVDLEVLVDCNSEYGSRISYTTAHGF